MDDIMSILDELHLDSATVAALSWVAGIVLVVAVIAMILSVVMYIFQAVGIYSAAKRRGIHHAWLAWIPMAQYWVAGSLSDQYKQTVKGQKSYNRIILLVLAIAGWVVSMAASGITGSALVNMIESALNNDMESLAYASTMASGSSNLLSILNSGLSLALLIFWQITLFDIYSASCPKYRVAYLVLGIIFKFTIPFFLFFSRKKDEGMRIPQSDAGTAYTGTVEYL